MPTAIFNFHFDLAQNEIPIFVFRSPEIGISTSTSLSHTEVKIGDLFYLQSLCIMLREFTCTFHQYNDAILFTCLSLTIFISSLISSLAIS